MKVNIKYQALILGGGLLALSTTALWGQGNTGAGTGDPAKDIGEVRGMLAQMDAGEARVGKILQEAKRQKDIIKVSCVNEKLGKLKNIIALAREQFSQYLKDKVSGSEGELVPLRQKVAIFKERADETVAEAERCAGEAIVVTDKPEVTEAVDPSVPQWDPTEPSGPTWVAPRPPEASPYF